MTIKFYTNEEPKILTFDMIEEGQFFIDQDGWLCQKTTSNWFVTIADDMGNPNSLQYRELIPRFKVTKILPKVTKITWR